MGSGRDFTEKERMPLGIHGRGPGLRALQGMHLVLPRVPSRDGPPGDHSEISSTQSWSKFLASPNPEVGSEDIAPHGPQAQCVVQLRGEDSGTQQGERGERILGTAEGGGSVCPAPEGRGDTFQLKKTLSWCDLDPGGQDTSPSQPALELSPSDIS